MDESWANVAHAVRLKPPDLDRGGNAITRKAETHRELMADSFSSSIPNDTRPQFPSTQQSPFSSEPRSTLQNHTFQPPSSSHNTPQFGPSNDSQFHASAFAAPSPPPQSPTTHSRADDPQFDIFDWFPKYQSCQRYFIDHSQHSSPVQAVTAFINIQLPLQRSHNPITNSQSRLPPSPSSLGSLNFSSTARSPGAGPTTTSNHAYTSISLIPYLRRLVVTGLDFPGVLHGFFGDDWASGIGPLHEQERRNYLFAAKSGGWAIVKKDYDMGPTETVPFMRPLQNPVGQEIEAAEKTWSEWLAMEDWMVGPRAPEGMQGMQGQQEPQGGQGGQQGPQAGQSNQQQAPLQGTQQGGPQGHQGQSRQVPERR
ncbi:MAG: hypothetical protein Q9170_007781 [Blastenia crenularia]